MMPFGHVAGERPETEDPQDAIERALFVAMATADPGRVSQICQDGSDAMVAAANRLVATPAEMMLALAVLVDQSCNSMAMSPGLGMLAPAHSIKNALAHSLRTLRDMQMREAAAQPSPWPAEMPRA